MASRSYFIQQSPCVNLSANFIEENELASQEKRSNPNNNEATTFLEASTPHLILFLNEDLFTKFIKVFMKIMQAQAQVLVKPQKSSLKARTLEIYWGKSHIECYHFCQQCKNYFETFGAIGTNYTLFVTLLLRGSISIKWTQHKRRHKSTIFIIWSDFKIFLRKNLRTF